MILAGTCVTVDVARRLRANARSDHPLPIEDRESIAALLDAGMPQLARLALDAAIASWMPAQQSR